MSEQKIPKTLYLDDMTEEQMRTTIRWVRPLLEDPKTDYPITIVLGGHSTTLYTANEMSAYIEGLISSRISAFTRIANEPWNYMPLKDLN